MCGIAGVVTPPEVQGQRGKEAVERMVSRLRHRGPDGEGHRQWGRVTLGHSRLAIIDLSEHALQPLLATDGKAAIVFNGEIYNYIELRQQLQAQGWRFRTTSDTEVALAAWRQWGALAFERFVGMWAMAIYDAVSGTLVLSRDRFGIKPLCYAVHDRHLVFGSEPQAIVASGLVRTGPDLACAAAFLLTGATDSGEETFFSGIRHLSPGTYQVWPPDWDGYTVPSPSRYWRPPCEKAEVGYREAVDQVRQLLDDSVRLHLRSDVPVGMCLSGGLDSSTLVGLASANLSGRGGAPETFTASVSGAAFDERHYARAVVDRFRLRNATVVPTAEEFAGDLDTMLAAQGEPAASPGIYLQWRLFRLIGGAGLKVVLDGQGADEIFAGYLTFLRPFLLESGRLTGLRRAVRFSPTIFASLRGLSGRFGSFGALVARITWNAGIDTNRNAMSQLVLGPPVSAPPGRYPASTPLQEMLLHYIADYSLPSLLRYEDRNSMAFSVEARVPYLDHRLVEYALRLPDDHLFRGGRTKSVLRDAAAPYLPSSVRRRRDKLGFATPHRLWVNRVVINRLPFLLETEFAHDVVNVEATRALLRSVQQGTGPDVSPDVWWRLYSLLGWAEGIRR